MVLHSNFRIPASTFRWSSPMRSNEMTSGLLLYSELNQTNAKGCPNSRCVEDRYLKPNTKMTLNNWAGEYLSLSYFFLFCFVCSFLRYFQKQNQQKNKQANQAESYYKQTGCIFSITEGKEGSREIDGNVV